MIKKVPAIIFFVFIAFLVAFMFLYQNPTLTGFATYGSGGDFSTACQADISESSSLTSNQDCTAMGDGDYGPNLATNGITLNCAGFTIAGEANFGIKSVGNNTIIRRCVVTSFSNNLNFTGNNVSVIDSTITGGTGKDIWLQGGKNATFLNVTNNDADAVVSANANLFIQYYVAVSVVNGSGAAESGASVRIHNISGYASDLSGTTNAAGFVYFNVTDRVISNTGSQQTTSFTYDVNASTTGNSTVNDTVDIPVTAGIYMIYMNLTAAAGESDSEYPIFSNYLEAPIDSPNYNSSVSDEFNATITRTNGTAGIQFNGTNYSLSNISSEFYKVLNPLPAGVYSYYYWAFGNGSSRLYNYSSWLDYTVEKASTSISVYVNNSNSNFSAKNSSNKNIYLNASLSVSGTLNMSLNGNWINIGTSPVYNVTNLSEGYYNLSVYYDGNLNYSSSNNILLINITNTTSTATPVTTPGEGGGGCTPSSWTCAGWSECTGNQTRLCTSNCNTHRTEFQACAVQAYENATNKASNLPRAEIPRNSGASSFQVSMNEAVVISSVVVIAGVAIASAFWILLTLALVPFFWRRLKHYIVSVMDSDNELNFFDNKKVNKQKVLEFVSYLGKRRRVVYSSKRNGMNQFLLDRGFMEMQLDYPATIAGHFSNKKDAKRFEEDLRNINKKMIIMEKVEKASIFALIREISRRMRTSREIKKLK